MYLNDNSYFGDYLAGLFEGDGHIWVPKLDVFKNRYNPHFCITFHVKDLPLAEFIKNKIGFGWIRHKVRENTVVYGISNLKGHLLVLQILNNKLRTPKIHQVNKLIDWLNTKHGYNLSKMTVCISSLDNNAWLAGFSEADANFYVRVSQLKTKSRVAFRYALDQRMFDPVTLESSEFFLLKICELFDTKLHKTVRKHGNYFRIHLTSRASLNLVIKYFDKFPMHGVKSLNYQVWRQAFYIYYDDTRLTSEKLDKLKALKLSMNNLRTDFTLNHFLVNSGNAVL